MKKQRSKRKLLCYVIALCMALTMIPTAASALDKQDAAGKTGTDCTSKATYHEKASSSRASGAIKALKTAGTATKYDIEISGTFKQDEAYKMLVLVNSRRSSDNQANLTWDADLENLAMDRAAELAIYSD